MNLEHFDTFLAMAAYVSAITTMPSLFKDAIPMAR